ncbi:hypothetical protein G7Z17_g7836 [Cylindrodendrum hubeiense]|uniref:Uncharacterized protein n=1 Tax=Cylindrodendrum hubeiense TaxID=595255 RepID=A0A9P5LFC1_9HYPO|nr:hypothetical protein G7Z17_g7836 [Cylindrodendrum hubeiense]
MLVSYKTEHLNKFLATAWEKHSEVNDIELIDDRIQDDLIRRSFRLELSSPLLGFALIPGGCVASLTIPISGSIMTETYINYDSDTFPHILYDMSQQDIPKDLYNLKVSVPVESVTGDVGADRVNICTKWDNNIIAFGRASAEDTHIILHFASPVAQYSVDIVEPATERASVASNPLNNASDLIKQWFNNRANVSSIHCKLAPVRPMGGISGELGMFLKPKNFRLVPNGDAVCIYIKIEGSGATEGDIKPSFTDVDGAVICPIPEGSSASIIFSHRLLHEKVFLPLLQQCQGIYSEGPLKSIAWGNGGRGFWYGFYLKGESNVNMEDQSEVYTSNMSAVKARMDDAMTTMNIEDNRVTFSYSQTYQVEWRNDFTTLDDEPHPGLTRAGELEVVLRQTGKAFSTDNSNLILDLSISRNSFSLRKWSTVPGVRLFNNVQNGRIEFQDVVLRSPNVSFIAAESVLAPGATMIKTTHVDTPYDLILVGDMVDRVARE